MEHEEAWRHRQHIQSLLLRFDQILQVLPLQVSVPSDRVGTLENIKQTFAEFEEVFLIQGVLQANQRSHGLAGKERDGPDAILHCDVVLDDLHPEIWSSCVEEIGRASCRER